MSDLDRAQITKAVEALLKHLKSTKPSKTSDKKQLLDDPSELENEPIYFQITSKRTFTEDASTNLKPIKISLPHSPYPSSSTCLVITRDPHDPFAKKLKGNPKVQQCLGMGSIRKTFTSYEQLRRLRQGEIIGEEPVFVLADEKIVVSLPKVLGKAFYSSARSVPIAVKMSPDTVVQIVEDAFGKSYVRKNAGNCASIRVGYVGLKVEELVDNCIAAWQRCIVQKKLVKQGVEGTRSAFIKSMESVALPVWTTEELYSAEDVLEESVEDSVEEPKKVKSKADRKLLKEKAEKEQVPEPLVGTKRIREDDVETAFEERRARKAAKKEKGTSK